VAEEIRELRLFLEDAVDRIVVAVSKVVQ